MRKDRLLDSVADLRTWLNHHPLRTEPRGALFVSLGPRYKYRPLRYPGVYDSLRNIRRAAGLKKPLHPHLLHHSRLTEMARTLSESELKVYAGWTGDADMARVYIHLGGDDVDRKILEKAGLLKGADEPKPNPLAQRKAIRCGGESSAAAEVCSTCSLPLNEQKLRDLTREYDSLREKLPLPLDLLDDPSIARLVAKRARTLPVKTRGSLERP